MEAPRTPTREDAHLIQPPDSANSLLGGGISPLPKMPRIPSLNKETTEEELNEKKKLYDQLNRHIAEGLCLMASNASTMHNHENIIKDDMESFMMRLGFKNDILRAVISKEPFFVQYDRSKFIEYYSQQLNTFKQDDVWDLLKSRLMYMFVEKLICEGSQGFDKKSNYGLLNLALKILVKDDVKNCLLVDFCSNKKARLNQGLSRDEMHLVKDTGDQRHTMLITNLVEAIDTENAYCIYQEIVKIIQVTAQEEERTGEEDIGVIDVCAVLRKVAGQAKLSAKKESIGVIAFAMLIFQIFLSVPIQTKLDKPDKFQEPVDTNPQIHFNSTVCVCDHKPSRKRKFENLSKATEDEIKLIVNYKGDVRYSDLTLKTNFNLCDSKYASSKCFVLFKKLSEEDDEEIVECGNLRTKKGDLKTTEISDKQKQRLLERAQKDRDNKNREEIIDQLIQHKFGNDDETDLIVMTSLRLCVTTRLDLLLSSHDRKTTSIPLSKYACLTLDRSSHHYILKGVGYGIFNDIKYSSYGLIPSETPTFHQWSSYDFSLFYIAKQFKNSIAYVKFILDANTKLEEYIGYGKFFLVDDWNTNHPMPTLLKNGLPGAGPQFNVMTNLNTYTDTIVKKRGQRGVQHVKLSSKTTEKIAKRKLSGSGLEFSHEILYFRVDNNTEDDPKQKGSLRDVIKIHGGFPVINHPTDQYREPSDGPNGGAYNLFKNAKDKKEPDFLRRSKLQRMVIYSMFGVDAYHKNNPNPTKNVFDPSDGFRKTCIEFCLSTCNPHADTCLFDNKGGGFSTKDYENTDKYIDCDLYYPKKTAEDFYGTSGMSFFVTSDAQQDSKKELLAMNIPRIVALCGGPLAIGLLMNDKNVDFRPYPFKGGEITMLNNDSSAFLKFQTWNTCMYLHSLLLVKLIGTDITQGICTIKKMKALMSSLGKYVSGFTEVTDPKIVELKIKRRNHFLSLRDDFADYGDNYDSDNDEDNDEDNDHQVLRAGSPALHDSLEDFIERCH